MPDPQVKEDVRHFYDQVGWQRVDGDQYQNAQYEDLRPVSSEYIHRCHLRVNRFLRISGKYLLDAGSGPVQYPEYLSYSDGYRYRVCADISLVAVQEARRRLGAKGLCVVADVANLPFRADVFEGVVSLHTLHHIPAEEQVKAYGEIYRVMAPASSAVVVNGWTSSRLMNAVEPVVKRMERAAPVGPAAPRPGLPQSQGEAAPAGTFVHKITPAWLKSAVGSRINLQIRCWRSVSVRFLRVVVQPHLAGRLLLRVLFWLEERFPKFFGENGQYPLVVIRKP